LSKILVFLHRRDERADVGVKRLQIARFESALYEAPEALRVFTDHTLQVFDLSVAPR